MSSRWSLNFEGGLASNFVDGGLVGEFRDKLIGLDVDILLARRCLRSFNVTREELFRCFRPLLLHGLGVVLGLVRVKQFVGVSAGRNDHSSVSTSTVHTLIIHNVVRGVVLCGDVAIRVLILRFGLNNPRCSCKPLRARSSYTSSIWLL
jgi:hypothetical protein